VTAVTPGDLAGRAAWCDFPDFSADPVPMWSFARLLANCPSEAYLSRVDLYTCRLAIGRGRRGDVFPEKESASMTKEISRNDQESLVKTSAEGSVELSEGELKQVAGGQKNKVQTQDYLKVTLENVLISG
jgi:hypothetical protein